MRLAATVVCLLALTITASGCGFLAQKAAEKTIEGATGNKVDVDGEKVTIEGEDGSKVEVGGDQKLPDGFPADAPMYDGAKIEGSTTAAGANGGTAYTVSYYAPDDMQTVANWYAKQLKDGGWKSVMSATTGDGSIMSSEKGDQVVNVSVNPAEGEAGFKSQVVIMIGPK